MDLRRFARVSSTRVQFVILPPASCSHADCFSSSYRPMFTSPADRGAACRLPGFGGHAGYQHQYTTNQNRLQMNLQFFSTGLFLACFSCIFNFQYAVLFYAVSVTGASMTDQRTPFGRKVFASGASRRKIARGSSFFRRQLGSPFGVTQTTQNVAAGHFAAPISDTGPSSLRSAASPRSGRQQEIQPSP